MRLFSALLPPAAVRASLAAELHRLGADSDAGGDTVGGLRWVPAESRHITLGFYGDGDDSEHRVEWLRERLAGRAAVDIRLVGGGTFPGVLWTAAQGDGLGELAVAAGEGFHSLPFRAHLTLARGRSRRLLTSWARSLDGYRGPDWHVDEVVLMRSEPGPAGPRHSALERFPLGGRGAENAH